MFMCSITSKEKNIVEGVLFLRIKACWRNWIVIVFLCVTQSRYKYDVVCIYYNIYT